jgi:hypothetical protein
VSATQGWSFTFLLYPTIIGKNYLENGCAEQHGVDVFEMLHIGSSCWDLVSYHHVMFSSFDIDQSQVHVLCGL